MKNYKEIVASFILLSMAVLTIGCSGSIGTNNFTIQEYTSDQENDGRYKLNNVYSSKGKGSSVSIGSKNDDQQEAIAFNIDKEKLSEVLIKLGYFSVKEKDLKQNPLLKIEFYNNYSTKKSAYKKIVNRLKEIYHF